MPRTAAQTRTVRYQTVRLLERERLLEARATLRHLRGLSSGKTPTPAFLSSRDHELLMRATGTCSEPYALPRGAQPYLAPARRCATARRRRSCTRTPRAPRARSRSTASRSSRCLDAAACAAMRDGAWTTVEALTRALATPVRRAAPETYLRAAAGARRAAPALGVGARAVRLGCAREPARRRRLRGGVRLRARRPRDIATMSRRTSRGRPTTCARARLSSTSFCCLWDLSTVITRAD